jgi:hypothetical protein
MFVTPMKEAVAAALFKDYHGDEWEDATENARLDYLHRADLVMRTMDRSEIMNVLHTLATVLNGVMPLIEKAAAQEAKEGEGLTLKRVTQQRRLEAAKSAVDRAFEIMGISHD